jgi:hypothetical protein
MIELAGDLVSEQPAGTTRTNSPRFYVLWIGPDEVAERALVRNLLGSGHHADLVDGADLWAEAAVDAQDLAIDNGGEDKEVKNVTAGLPHRSVAVLLLTFLVEAVYLCNLAGLVVASDKDDAIGVSAKCQAEFQPRTMKDVGNYSPASSYLALRHMSSVNVSRLK